MESVEYRVTAHQDNCDFDPLHSVVTGDTSLVVENLQPATHHCFTVTALPRPTNIAKCFTKTKSKGDIQLTRFDCKHDTSAKLMVTTVPAPPAWQAAINCPPACSTQKNSRGREASISSPP